MTLTDDIREFALGQDGVISTQQSARLGATPNDLVRLVRDGQLLHPFRGAYLLPDPDGDSPTDEARHLRLCRAARLIYPTAVLGGVSGALAHGLPGTGADLARPVLHHGRHRGIGVVGIRMRRARDVESVMSDHGPTLPLAATLMDHARDNGTLPGVIAMDAALYGNAVTSEDLDAALTAVRNWPRAARAAAALDLVDGRSESPGESWTRFVLAVAGIETIPQVELRDDAGTVVARVDLLVEGTKTVVEFDGRLKYTSAEVLWAEKKREDRLRRLGYTVVRITWSDLHQPGRVVALVRQAVAA
jgi:hypothetical protein